MDDGGAVTGLLNIAKCLYDAIHRLEKKAARTEEQGGSGEAQELAASLLKVRRTQANDSVSVLCLAPSFIKLWPELSVLCVVTAGDFFSPWCRPW